MTDRILSGQKGEEQSKGLEEDFGSAGPCLLCVLCVELTTIVKENLNHNGNIPSRINNI